MDPQYSARLVHRGKMMRGSMASYALSFAKPSHDFDGFLMWC